MTIQPSPRQANNLHQYLEQVDRAAGNSTGNYDPPIYGGPHRDGIQSLVDAIVGEICTEISMLHKTLDRIEAEVLKSGASAKHHLNEHVSVCVQIHDEVAHMREVIADLESRSVLESKSRAA